jgi:inner membrane protein YidH
MSGRPRATRVHYFSQQARFQYISLIFACVYSGGQFAQVIQVIAHRMPNTLAVSRTDLAPEASGRAKAPMDLGVSRTLMAADRTLMAWIRTSLSMLSFGFTIYKFLLYIRESVSEGVFRAQGPRRFGIFLIALGTLSIVFGVLDYYRITKGLEGESGRKPWSFVLLVGALTAFLGLFLLVTILSHREVF